MAKCKFEIGDKVMLKGCPYDEQIPEEMEKFIAICQKTDTVLDVLHMDDGRWICVTELFGELHQDWLKKAK